MGKQSELSDSVRVISRLEMRLVPKALWVRAGCVWKDLALRGTTHVDTLGNIVGIRGKQGELRDSV